MKGDDRLRTELEALERAAPTGQLPETVSSTARTWRRIGLIGATGVAAVALTALAFGLGRSLDIGSRSSSPDPSEPPANPPAVAETRVGDFILTISSPKTVWTTEESIEVTAALTYVGLQTNMTIGQGIPPVGFTLRSASGDGPTLIGMQLQPCLQYDVSANQPLVEVYRKGVPITADGRPVDAAPPFDQEFLNDPQLRLPIGEWEFTALTDFAERGCGDDYQLGVSITLQVIAPSSPSPVPSADSTPQSSDPESSATPHVRVCAAALAYGTLGADAGGNPILIFGDDLPPASIVFSYPEDFVIESTPVLTIYDRDGNVLAREGDEVELGGGFNAGDTIFYACSVLSNYSPSAAPGREIQIGGIHVTLPPGWTYHLPTFVSHGPAWPIVYFSNQPMHDECIRTSNSETCDRPIDELVPDGVLIDWWASGEYPYPTPRALPSGAPYEVGGLDAVRFDTRPEDCGLHATEAERVVFRRSDNTLDQLTVCSREVTGAIRTELEELLASIEFTAASD